MRRSVATPFDAALSTTVVVIVVAVAIPLAHWASTGACWTFVGHKLALIVFGLYPPAERWRAGLALGALVALIGVSGRSGAGRITGRAAWSVRPARALGLRAWQMNRLVILPQALRVVVPSFVSIAVGFFQDTSLVVIIGLFDLLNTARVAAQDPQWLGFHTEGFVFVALIYVAGSTPDVPVRPLAGADGMTRRTGALNK